MLCQLNAPKRATIANDITFRMCVSGCFVDTDIQMENIVNLLVLLRIMLIYSTSNDA